MTFHLTPDQVSPHVTGELAVVIPIYNEEATIKQVVSDWRGEFQNLGINYCFLLINDGSKDNTLRVLESIAASDPGLVMVVNKSNAGHGRTCRFGYDIAVGSQVEWVLQIDSDGQCDPAYFKNFWEARADADCVFGIRKQRDDGTARMLTSKICKLGSTVLGGRDMGDPNVPYRLLRTATLREALKKIPASFDIHNVALTFILKQNSAVRWKYIPIRFRDRQGGSNSINLLNVAHLGVSMLFDLAKLRQK